ncbi:EAL domain-containing protein [Rheinheimera texasensis]|uniref:putative bifunctional diguanylate cyclase/phosphodiesterase n=1 Tax=Rheinheimera texasensis TaxID=306205 RepID=UPI0032B18682
MSWLVRHPIRVAVAVGMLLLTLLAILVWQQQQKNIEVERYQLLQQVSHHAASLEATIRTAVVVSESLRNEIILHPQQPLAELENRVDLLLKDYPLFRHIALAPDLVIRYVYPRAGNEAALGVNYRLIPEQYAAIEKAIALGGPLLAGPVKLVQGGSGLILRVPVFTGDKQLWGVIAAVIPLERLLQQTQLEQFREDYYLGLSGRDGNINHTEFFWGDLVLQGLPSVYANIRLPNGQWRLHAFPKQRLPVLAGLPPLFLPVGLLLTLILTVGLYVLLRLSQERQQALQTVAWQASFDPLTGLANRAVLLGQLELMLKQARAQGGQLAVLSLDLDEFKQVNESLGHPVGDQLLQLVADRLLEQLTGPELVARSGGDEFVLVVPEHGPPELVEQFCQTLLNAFHAPFMVNSTPLSISTSIGVAMYPNDGLLAIDLLKHADRAMYAAKHLGRNTFHFYDAGMQKEADHFVHLHHEIIKGIEQRQFFLMYQPIYDVENQRFSKAEALVRWQHPERGLIPPFDFIPVAERTGAIRPLGQWILQQAITDMQLFGQMGLQLQISVNRSSQEFNQAKCADDWMAQLSAAGLAPEQLILEITESVFMDKVSVQQANVLSLHQQGVQLAIDDFGTGYSALNYLSRYPVDFIKIDKSFINLIAEQDKARALVAVLINMAKVLDVQVVAEGVETAEQFSVLQQLGCDFIQGYYFSRPLAKADLISLVQKPVLLP